MLPVRCKLDLSACTQAKHVKHRLLARFPPGRALSFFSCALLLVSSCPVAFPLPNGPICSVLDGSFLPVIIFNVVPAIWHSGDEEQRQN